MKEIINLPINAKLRDEIYVEYVKALFSTNNKHFLLKDNTGLRMYSNPYLIGVTSDWNDNNIKVLIVGEEGRGNWGIGARESVGASGISFYFSAENLNEQNRAEEFVKRMQEASSNTVRRNLKETILDYSLIRSAFWHYIRHIAKECGNSNKRVAIAYTNMDKVHYCKSTNRKKAVLNGADRACLHTEELRIIEKEINIIKPDFVILLGYHWEAVDQEFHKLSAKIRAADWKQKAVVLSDDGEKTTYIATYHPNWDIRNGKCQLQQIIETINTVQNK